MKNQLKQLKEAYRNYKGKKQLEKVFEAVKSFNHIVGEAIYYEDFEGLKNIDYSVLDVSLFLLLIEGRIYEPEPAHYRILE